MNGDPSRSPLATPLTDEGLTTPPVAQVSAVNDTVSSIGAALTGEVDRAVVGAAQALDSCADAINAAIVEIHRQAALAHGSVGDAIELDSYGAMSLAWQIAQSVGCNVEDIPGAVAERLRDRASTPAPALPPPQPIRRLPADATSKEATAFIATAAGLPQRQIPGPDLAQFGTRICDADNGDCDTGGGDSGGGGVDVSTLPPDCCPVPITRDYVCRPLPPDKLHSWFPLVSGDGNGVWAFRVTPGTGNYGDLKQWQADPTPIKCWWQGSCEGGPEYRWPPMGTPPITECVAGATDGGTGGTGTGTDGGPILIGPPDLIGGGGTGSGSITCPPGGQVNIQVECKVAAPPSPEKCPPVDIGPPGGDGGPGGPPGPPAGGAVDPFGKLLRLMKPADWRDPAVCTLLAAEAGDAGDIGAAFVVALTGQDPFKEDVDLTAWAETFVTRADFGVLQGPVAATLAGLVKVGADILHRFSSLLADDRSKAVLPEAMAAILTAVEKWTGLGFSRTITDLNNQANFWWPTQLPDQGTINQLFLSNQIDVDKWSCLTRAIGNVEWPQVFALKAQRVKPGVSEVIQLYHRGEFGFEEAMNRLRDLGVVSDPERRELFKLADFVPGSGDIIRFMVRDIFDEDLYRKYALGSEFGLKFQGEALAMARANGISAATMEKYWAAHWRLPGIGQGYEMLHRLRPGRVDDKLVTTEDDVRQLLAADDMLPYYRDRLIALSYRVMSRIDSRLAYKVGALSKDELVEKFKDYGYDDKSSAQLTESYKRQRIAQYMAGKIASGWLQGYVSDTELEADARTYGIVGEEWTDTKDRLDKQAVIKTRRACTAGLHKRYMMGEFTDDQIVTQLIALGIGAGQADRVARGWRCEREAKGKQAGAAELCGWMEAGLISPFEHVQRLFALGYRGADVDRVRASCLLRINEKARKAALAVSKAESAARKAKDREALRRLKEAQRSETKAEAGALKKERAGEKAMVQLAKAYFTSEVIDGIKPEEARDKVDDQVRRVQKDKGYTLDGAIALVAEVLREVKSAKTGDWVDRLSDLLRR